MLVTREKILFAILILATAAAFFLPLIRRYRVVRSGRPDSRFNELWKRLRHSIVKVLFQRCTLRNERFFTGLIHVLIFYGALTFDTMTINHTLEGFFDGFYLFGDSSFGLFFSLLVDVAAIAVMIGVLFLAFRRYIIRPKAYATTPVDSAFIYTLITVATLTYLYFEAFAIALHPDTVRLSFLGGYLAGRIQESGLNLAAVAWHFKLSWWTHVVAVYVFIAYVPHSKYLHMIAGPLNVFFRPEAPYGEIKALDLENSETFGILKLSDFTWKDNLDAFACMECGRCQDACPAFASGKPLSPKMILFNQEKSLLENRGLVTAHRHDDLAELVPDTFTEGEIWTCTTCGACMNKCPVEIDHIGKIVGLRQGQVLMQSKFPPELNAFFRNMETNSNPWGIGFSKRAEWAEGLDVKPISEFPEAEYLFWVGCMGAYDDEGKKISRALVSILNRAGVTFAILGSEEKCCGDSARKLGNEYLFQTLAQENLALFKTHKVRKIVTICPHGYNAFKHEYPKLIDLVSGLNGEEKENLRSIEIVSHIELILGLVSSGRLRMKSVDSAAYVYHDSCYLGRHNGLTNEPRAILRASLSGPRRELKNHGNESFCCGAGGGLMWTEENLGQRINHLRVNEVIQAGVSLASTSCPFCSTMLRDGLKDKGRDDIQVKDIAQVVAESLDD